MATRDTYTKQTWENLPSEQTPITAERLSHIEDGIASAMDNRALKEVYGDASMKLQSYDNSEITEIGTGSLVHGAGSCAPLEYSYAGGINLKNTGNHSHAEGSANTINGGYSVHVEGNRNQINGSNYSHEEGESNQINAGECNHVEGKNNIENSCCYVHLEGYGNKANPISTQIRASHVEGEDNVVSGNYTHIEGASNKDVSGGGYNHLEGSGNTMCGGQFIHMEGYSNHAGNVSKKCGYYAHLEGTNNIIFGTSSHIEGEYNKENEDGSFSVNHIEGSYNEVSGNCACSHISGRYNKANGANYNVHMSGDNNISLGSGGGNYSGMITGSNNVLIDSYQFVAGKYCQPMQGAVLIGGGDSSERKNILYLDWSGNLSILGDITNGVGISLNSLKSAIDNMGIIAEGGSIAKVFDTKADLDAWLAVAGNPETLTAGQNIYIVETGTPDYWWDGTGLQVLETDKVVAETLTYDETMAILNASEEVT